MCSLQWDRACRWLYVIDGGRRPQLLWRFMTDAWKAPAVERAEPGLVLGERQALEAWLDFHRETLLFKCAGLTAGQLKERAVPPSRLSLLGLVRHMTEVERWWFRMHAANADMPFPYDPDQNGQDFEALGDADAAANIVVAYEPVWAIGSGQTPTPSDIGDIHDFIRARLDVRFGEAGHNMRILYGGSVKPANARQLLTVENVDGALVGGASLDAAEFLAIAGTYR